ncbi:MAG: alpha/beta hydrolase family esterase [bacterium]
MIWRNFWLAIFLALTAPASSWGDTASWQEFQLIHADQQRSYWRYSAPSCQPAQAPALIVALHGGGGKARGFARYSGFSEFAEQYCLTLLYPQGVNKHWHDARFPDQAATIDDSGFIRRLINEQSALLGIDASRVFVVGMSNGGVFALQLAVTHPEVFAGVAAVTAQLPVGVKAVGNTLPPLILINGTDDPIMPYNGGAVSLKDKQGKAKGGTGKVVSTQQVLQTWQGQSDQSFPTVTTEHLNKRPWDKTEIEIQHWDNRLKLIKVIGGGHTWPGRGQYLPKFIVGPASRELDATRSVLEFFLGSP